MLGRGRMEGREAGVGWGGLGVLIRCRGAGNEHGGNEPRAEETEDNRD